MRASFIKAYSQRTGLYIKKDYFLHLPVQTVSGASIDYTKTDEIYNNNDLFVVMDTH